MTDDLPFDYPSAPNPGAPKPRICKRHTWTPYTIPNLAGIEEWCSRCQRWRDPAASKRGRNNRARGNAIEREVGKQLGLRRVGQYGGPDDLTGDMFAAQVKSGGAFPERLWSWLKAVPVTGAQTPLLVVTDAPGPGHKRRAVVVLDIADWIALHGPTEDPE
jgi:hypothetical protein